MWSSRPVSLVSVEIQRNECISGYLEGRMHRMVGGRDRMFRDCGDGVVRED